MVVWYLASSAVGANRGRLRVGVAADPPRSPPEKSGSTQDCRSANEIVTHMHNKNVLVGNQCNSSRNEEIERTWTEFTPLEKRCRNCQTMFIACERLAAASEATRGCSQHNCCRLSQNTNKPTGNPITPICKQHVMYLQLVLAAHGSHEGGEVVRRPVGGGHLRCLQRLLRR